MAWPESLRSRICGACRQGCAEAKAGTLDLGRHEAACPLGKWGAWREPRGTGRDWSAPAAWPAQPSIGGPAGAVAAGAVAPMEKLGPRLWAELHRRPWACDLAREEAWLREDFAPRLVGCACRAHWLRALLHTPADLGSHEAYFAWTAARHNEVRRRQGKVELTLEQAYAEWHPGLVAPEAV